MRCVARGDSGGSMEPIAAGGSCPRHTIVFNVVVRFLSLIPIKSGQCIALNVHKVKVLPTRPAVIINPRAHAQQGVKQSPWCLSVCLSVCLYVTKKNIQIAVKFMQFYIMTMRTSRLCIAATTH